MKRLRAWLGVVFIFLLGAVCGAVLSAGVIHQKMQLLLHGGNAKVEDPIVGKLRRELHLDPAQVAQVRQIVADTRAQIEGLRQQQQPYIREAMVGGEEKVHALLRPDQADKFAKLVRESHEKWQPKVAQ